MAHTLREHQALSGFWNRITLIAMSILSQDELSRLTPPERLALIAQLWDSIESDQIPLTEQQQAELDRRLETLDHDRRGGITWAALKAQLQQR
jgi:putative addiction module component (TIGR02574 family)